MVLYIHPPRPPAPRCLPASASSSSFAAAVCGLSLIIIIIMRSLQLSLSLGRWANMCNSIPKWLNHVSAVVRGKARTKTETQIELQKFLP